MYVNRGCSLLNYVDKILPINDQHTQRYVDNIGEGIPLLS